MWPEPNSTAAGVRLLQLLDVFLNSGFKVTVASTASKVKFSADLDALGIRTQAIVLNDASFDLFVSQLQPSIVLFDRFLTEEQFGWRIAEQVPEALRILDTEDLHSLRHVRQLCFKKGTDFTISAWLEDDKTKREIASIYRCDLSLIISSYELELLIDILKIDKRLLLLLPFMVDEIKETNHWPSYEQRTGFMFIGSGKHAPNIDAIMVLKSKIWPSIRQQLPEAKLHIYGAYFSQQVLEYHNPKKGFLVEGRAENSKTVIQEAKVCLAPLRFGAGIKGKLLHAMQFGTPSVTTTLGAEGMHGILRWNGHIVNDPEEFANAAVHLYTQKENWTQAQQNGITLINMLYNKTSLATLFLKQVEQLQVNLKKHRQYNFMGSLLQHQSLAATKYLGQWIEEKNRGK